MDRSSAAVVKGPCRRDTVPFLFSSAHLAPRTTGCATQPMCNPPTPGSVRPMKPKRSAFKFSYHVPVMRDTADPEYAAIYLLFVCAVVGALIAFGQSSSAYTRILQAAGGTLVVLGVYLTSANLRISRSEQYAGRLTTAIGQLDSQSEAVRLGTIRLLQAILGEAPHVTAEDRERLRRYKRAVIDVLDAISSRGVTREAVLARAVSDEVAVTLADTTVS
jgi:hypothetical protein